MHRQQFEISLDIVIINKMFKSRHVNMMNNLKQNEKKDKGSTSESYLFELQKIWDQEKIPEYQRTIFLHCIKMAQQSIPNTIDIIRNEINNLRCKRATVQVCLKAIKSRENCISLLRSTLGSNYFDLKNKVDKCCEIITHLRILNINVTESVFKWREGLLRDFQIQDNQIIVIPFIYEKHNYLLKMLDDQTFIHETELKKVLNLSTKCDPFLLLPTLDPDIDLKKNVQSRILNAEKILIQEIMNSDRELTNNQAEEAFVTLKSLENVRFNAKPKRQFHIRKNNSKSKIERQLDKIQPSPQKNKSQEKKSYFQYSRQIIIQKEKTIEDNHVVHMNPDKEIQPIQTPEVEIQPIQREVNLSIQPLGIYENEYQSFYRTYQQKISEVQQNNFKTLDISSLQECYYFNFMDHEDLVGFAIVHLDKDYLVRRRLIIGHFSVIKEELMTSCFELLINMIYEKDKCAEIRTAVQHQGEPLSADKTMQELLKAHQFRWKQLINDKFTKQKYTIYGISREVDPSNEQIMINATSTLIRSKKIHQDSFYNRLCEILMLKKNNIDFFTNYQLEDDFNFAAAEYMEPNIVQMKLCYRWKSFKYLKHEQKMYLYHFNMSEQENIFECKTQDQTIYLLNTDDPDVFLFVGQSTYNNDSQDFSAYVENILQSCEEKTLLTTPLMIPEFQYQGKNTVQVKSSQILLNDITFQCQKDSQLDGLLKQRLESIIFQLDPIIISYPFIIGVVHLDVASSLSIPLVATIIEK